MGVVQKTLAVIALLVLLTQSVRHSYLLWFEPRTSVLDKYERPLREEIAAAKSLDELVARYEPIHQQAEKARKELRAQKRAPGVPDEVYADASLGSDSEFELRQAIKDWEQKAKEVHQLRFYFGVGLVFLVLGAAVFRVWNVWLGLALEVAAYSEFIYWTSPTFFGGAVRELDRLLTNKLSLSILALVLLLGLVWLQGAFAPARPDRRGHEAA